MTSSSRRKMEPLIGARRTHIKIDFRLSDKQRKRTLHQLKDSGVKLVAEKVETEQELKTALDEGFDLFQGYFAGRPSIFSKRKTPVDTTSYLRMLTAMTASCARRTERRRCWLIDHEVFISLNLTPESWQSWCA